MGRSVRKTDNVVCAFDPIAALAAERAVQREVQGHYLRHISAQLDPEALAASQAERWHLSRRAFPNGHEEVTLWREVPDLERAANRVIDRDVGHLVERGEGDREASQARASRRAKRQVRLLAKAMGVDSLWTLTYRANVVDRELVLKHLKAFCRRVRAVLGDWRYLAVLEQQGRGAWHIHLATHALPKRLASGGTMVKSWDVMRAIWRRITGELGGNFDESKGQRRWGLPRAARSAAAVARYLSKYIAKDIESSPLNRKRFSHSEGISIPEADRATFLAAEASVRDLLDLAFSALSGRCASAWWDAERGVFFAEAAPCPE